MRQRWEYIVKNRRHVYPKDAIEVVSSMSHQENAELIAHHAAKAEYQDSLLVSGLESLWPSITIEVFFNGESCGVFLVVMKLIPKFDVIKLKELKLL